VIVCNTRSAASGLRNEHVLISYHFTQQDSACVVRDKLNEAGFKVWIDIDDMRAYPYITSRRLYRQARLFVSAYRSAIGKESVPTIIINDTMIFFLNCNQHFGKHKP